MTRLSNVNTMIARRGKSIFVALLAIVILLIGISLVVSAYFIYNQVVSEESVSSEDSIPNSKNHITTTTTTITTTTTTTISEIKPKTILCNSPSICMSSQRECAGTFTKQNCGVDSSSEQGCCYITTTTTLPKNNTQTREFMRSPYNTPNKFNIGIFDKWS